MIERIQSPACPGEYCGVQPAPARAQRGVLLALRYGDEPCVAVLANIATSCLSSTLAVEYSGDRAAPEPAAIFYPHLDTMPAALGVEYGALRA
ncbi:hypothetical protein NDU88_003165 [Pleurodeles waltl]|uniref:Uncharacterized protein n=1 Tax=Pleurodeles waltl TaxID=8319 RepID=A0AAV7NQ67_PLEWA|nr:hypothetical protein NDU88_003165 [Pleurodeles waltl]